MKKDSECVAIVGVERTSSPSATRLELVIDGRRSPTAIRALRATAPSNYRIKIGLLAGADRVLARRWRGTVRSTPTIATHCDQIL